MFRKFLLRLLFFAGIVFVGLALFLNLSKSSEAYNIPDTPDTREMIAAMERAYDILAISFGTLDINKLSEVFIDDPVFLDRLTTEQREQARARVSTIFGIFSITWGSHLPGRLHLTSNLSGQTFLEDLRRRILRRYYFWNKDSR